MNTDGSAFWLAVIAMAVITYLTRALPFLLSERNRWLRRLSQDGSALAALGPSLLAGIAAAVIVPDLIGAGTNGNQVAPYVGGLVVTAVATRLVKNTGIAVLLGMAGYGLLLVLSV